MKDQLLKAREWLAKQSEWVQCGIIAALLLVLFACLGGCASDPFDSLKRQRDGNINVYCEDNATCEAGKTTHIHHHAPEVRVVEKAVPARPETSVPAYHRYGGGDL